MSQEDLVQPLYERDTDAVEGAFYVIRSVSAFPFTTGNCTNKYFLG